MSRYHIDCEIWCRNGEAMNFLEMDEERILSIVDPLMDNCLNGSNENNHAKHVKDFTERKRTS